MPRGLSKPSAGAHINWGHPLTNGLVAAFPHNDGAPGKLTGVKSLYEAVRRKPATSANNATANLVGTAYGVGLQYAGANSEYALPGLPGLVTAFSTSYFFYMDSTSDCKVWALNDLEIAFIGGGRARVVEPGVAELGVSSVMSAGRYYHVGISYSGATLRFYINGIPDNTASYSKTVPWANTSFSMGIDTKTFLSLNIWNRVLSANDFLQLATNPYEIWAAQSPLRFSAGSQSAASKAYYYSQIQGLR